LTDQDLTLVVTGAPLARRTVAVATALKAAGWDVNLTLSAASGAWVTANELAASGFGLREYGSGRPRPRVVVACPLTFNSANKLALGVSDEPHLGVLNDALGAGATIVVVPFVSDRLWGHPQWDLSLQRLREAGLSLLDPRGGAAVEAVTSGTGDQVADDFDPAWIVTRLKDLQS
jgi:hypothetical protein